MAKTPKATLISVENVPPPEERFDKMTPEEQRAAFVRKVMEQRAAAEAAKVPPPPPGLTERQRQQIEAEMARGREVSEKHAAALEAQRGTTVERDKWDGASTPVFRPADYVPNMNQGQKASTSARSSNV